MGTEKAIEWKKRYAKELEKQLLQELNNMMATGERVTVAKLAEKMGIPRSTIYNHRNVYKKLNEARILQKDASEKN